MNNVQSQKAVAPDAHRLAQGEAFTPPSMQVRALLAMVCMSLGQIEGALRRIREVLQAYERGDWAKFKALTGMN